MTRVLVVVAHPKPESLIRAALARVLRGLESKGEEVRLLDLDAEAFDPCLGREEKLAYGKPAATAQPELQKHFEALAWAEKLVLVYPTWFGSQPAKLKGWFDRVWIEGVAFDPGERHIKRGLSNIRRIDVVTSHGSSRRNNFLQGNAGRMLLFRTIRGLCHPRCRFAWTAIYSVDQAERVELEQWLDAVETKFGP